MSQTLKMTALKRKVAWTMSTHWDREWYDSFQGFRYRLVLLLDEVLAVMERDPRFKYFQMDGQSIPIEDYLEVRPEQADKIYELACSGRLKLGPWYTQPDEFIVSGESLVRNLAEGRRVAAQFGGEPLQVGFACDIFGHNSQLPQILKGFGIDCAFIWRGINESQVGPCFHWRSPDGTQVLAYRFGVFNGYCDYPAEVRQAHLHDYQFDPETAFPLALEFIRAQEARNENSGLPILMFDGGDHLEIEPQTCDLIDRLNNSEWGEKYDFSMCTLEDYAKLLQDYAHNVKTVIEGELREPGQPTGAKPERQWIIPGVLSSRIPLKQANARCEALLTQWAEPFSTFMGTYGLGYPAGFLRIAWRYLLANHAHDSICGCSIDQVHRDMQNRFEQVELIGKRLKKAALEHMLKPVARNYSAQLHDSRLKQVIVLVNPSSQPLDEPLDFTLPLPMDTPTFQEFFGYEPKPCFWLVDDQGNPLAYQRMQQTPNQIESIWKSGKLPTTVNRFNVRVAARVKIPAFGYATVGVLVEQGPTRHGGKGLAIGPDKAENEYLAIEFKPGGLLALRDKRTGESYEGLLGLEDRADIGDGWYHGVAVNDQAHYSGLCKATVALIADGPELATFRVELDWPLPGEFDFTLMRRVEERQSLRIIHEVTLRSGCARIELHTTVLNNVQDHRLRVLFPTRAAADCYLADSPFDVVSRPIALDPDHIHWRELETETKPQHSWTAVSDGRRGLAIIAPGLPESAVQDNADRTLALTLFRSFRKPIFTNGEPECQLQGALDFDYWLVPVAGEPDLADLSWQGQRLAAGIGTAVYDLPDALPPKEGRIPRLPASASFLQVEGPVVVTAVKTSESGDMIVRLFNPLSEAAAIRIARPEPIRRAWLCDLEEHSKQSIALENGAIALEVRPHQIVTVKVQDHGRDAKN